MSGGQWTCADRNEKKTHCGGIELCRKRLRFTTVVAKRVPPALSNAAGGESRKRDSFLYFYLIKGDWEDGNENQ